MKEVASLFKKKPVLGVTLTSIAGALGMYGIYSLSEMFKQNADITATRDGVKKHIPHDAVATAKDATSGRTIRVVAIGDRPNADASGAKAGEDLIVTAQGNNYSQEGMLENTSKNDTKIRR